MRMKGKSIACQPETDTEGGVESTSRGDTKKDQQQTMGGKAGIKKIGSALRTGGESLSETPRAAPTQSTKQPTNQTNKAENKQWQGRGGGGQKKRDTRREKGRKRKR